MLTPRLARLLARAGRLLRGVDRRLVALEALLGERLSEREARAIAEACRANGMRLGAYYAWLLRRMAIHRTLADSGRDTVRELLARHDASLYAPLDVALQDPRGLLLAIPHHGPFLLAIVALCERLRSRRDVFVLLEAGADGATGDASAALHRNLCAAPGGADRISLLHDDHAGLRRALRALRRGAAVVVMPDAYRSIEATYQVPFCGAQRHVMLGTAALARRGAARVLPVVARPRAGILGFANAFGPLLEPVRGDATREDALHADYRLTLAMFRAYEPPMAAGLPYWQYCKAHVADADFVAGLAPEDTVDIAGPLLLDDPRIRLHVGIPLVLDPTPADLSAA